jgi:dTDP-4-dehydrorhamnose 3,5-epimerase
MKITPMSIPDVLLVEPTVYEDDRGFFYESFNQRRFAEVSGIENTFVQDNHSRSKHGVLRGLHYQVHKPQGKLVRVVSGEVFDVVVDIRRDSKTFGQWIGFVLNASEHKQIWIPPGFAHGFLVLSEHADFLYKTTDYYAPSLERCIIWSDPDLAIEWPSVGGAYKLSEKDRQGALFARAEKLVC